MEVGLVGLVVSVLWCCFMESRVLSKLNQERAGEPETWLVSCGGY